MTLEQRWVQVAGQGSSRLPSGQSRPSVTSQFLPRCALNLCFAQPPTDSWFKIPGGAPTVDLSVTEVCGSCCWIEASRKEGLDTLSALELNRLPQIYWGWAVKNERSIKGKEMVGFD